MLTVLGISNPPAAEAPNTLYHPKDQGRDPQDSTVLRRERQRLVSQVEPPQSEYQGLAHSTGPGPLRDQPGPSRDGHSYSLDLRSTGFPIFPDPRSFEVTESWLTSKGRPPPWGFLPPQQPRDFESLLTLAMDSPERRTSVTERA
jgi:hypothetical protein